MYRIDEFEGLIKKAKIQRNIPKLEEIHYAILEALQYMQDFKKDNCRVETYHLNDEIHKLEDLNIKIFETYGQIQQNAHFRLQNIKNRQKRM